MNTPYESTGSEPPTYVVGTEIANSLDGRAGGVGNNVVTTFTMALDSAYFAESDCLQTENLSSPRILT